MRVNKPLLHGDITASIIDSFFDVHKVLGFGFSFDPWVHFRKLPISPKGFGEAIRPD